MNHDEFIKHNLERYEVIKGTLKFVLNEKLYNKIDFSKTKSEKTEFITEELKKHQSDALFRIFFKGGGETFLYLLIEHKSSVDKKLGSQLLKYLSDIVQKEVESTGKIIPIIPIVIYNGKDNWNPTGQFLSEYSYLEEFSDNTKELLDFSYRFLDISKVDELELRKNMGVRIFFKVLSDAMRDPKHMIENFAETFEAFRTVWEDDLPSVLHSYMIYMLGNKTVKTKEEAKAQKKLIEGIYKKAFGKEKGEEEMISIAEYIAEDIIVKAKEKGREEGREEGIQEGMEKGFFQSAMNLLKMGFSIEDVQRGTGLSREKIEELKLSLKSS